MKPSLFFSVTIISLSFTTIGIEASELPGTTPTGGEVAMQKEISRLEKQLKNARQTISGLETELETAINQLVVMRQVPAEDARVTRSITGTADSGAALVTTIPSGTVEPASITSVDVEELALGGVEGLARLEFLVPGLRYGQRP
jgi:hypothetical protein